MNKRMVPCCHECLDGFSSKRAEIEERSLVCFVIQRGLAVDEDSVRGIVRFALSGPRRCPLFRKMDGQARLEGFYNEQPLKTSRMGLQQP